MPSLPVACFYLDKEEFLILNSSLLIFNSSLFVLPSFGKDNKFTILQQKKCGNLIILYCYLILRLDLRWPANLRMQFLFFVFFCMVDGDFLSEKYR